MYIGGLVALAATGALLGILGDMHGDSALVGYSAVATAGALGLAARPMTGARLLGATLLVAGAILIRR